MKEYIEMITPEQMNMPLQSNKMADEASDQTTNITSPSLLSASHKKGALDKLSSLIDQLLEVLKHIPIHEQRQISASIILLELIFDDAQQKNFAEAEAKIEEFILSTEGLLKLEAATHLQPLLHECKVWLLHLKNTLLVNQRSLILSDAAVDHISTFLPTKDLINFSSSCTFFRENLQYALEKRKQQEKIVQIVTGENHTVILKGDGTVWTCGMNTFGQLGVGDNVTKQSLPVKIPHLIQVKQIAAGPNSTLFLKRDGTVWFCGECNDFYCTLLGFQQSHRVYQPVQVPKLSDIKQIAVGFCHSVFLDGNGIVWGWGSNKFGQLGFGHKEKKLSHPKQIPELTNIRQIETGYAHTLFLKQDGSVWGCGDNERGQLGLGEQETMIDHPKPIPTLSKTKQIAVGLDHSVFLKEDGTVWGCGSNEDGQLGVEETEQINRPCQISALTDIKQISTGYNYTLSLDKEGTVWGCGGNEYGQLNLISKEDQSLPTEMPELSNIQRIQASCNLSVFFREDTAWVCGGSLDDCMTEGKLSLDLGKTLKYVKLISSAESRSEEKSLNYP